MKAEDNISFDKQIYYRLIALWVVCESVIGGIIHGFKLPFSGLIVGSSAVVCISLIAFYVPVKGAILKATIIVAIFKMTLSPQTPPTAYIAVFFQGMMGQILFYNLRHYKLSCMLLGVFALVESALQRIIVLTLLYGATFWKAINEFISKLTNQKQITNYSLLITGGYILLHVFFGLLVGSFAARLVKRSEKWKMLHNDFIIHFHDDIDTTAPEKKTSSKKKVKIFFIFIWIALIILFLQSFLHIGKPIIPLQVSLQIILRSLLIILTWHFLVSPLLIRWMRKWLSAQHSKFNNDINNILIILPSTKYIFLKSWKFSSIAKGWKRIPFFCKILLLNTLR